MGTKEEDLQEQEQLEEKKPEQPDPGSLEGLPKKDPKVEQDKLTPDHPRFREIWGQLKETKKELENFKGTLQERDALIKEMRDWNSKLAEVVEKGTQSREVDPTKEAEETIAKLQTAYKEALTNVDYDLATKLNDQITDLKIDLRELKKASKETKVIKEPETDIPREFQEFMELPWFKSQPEMAAFAKYLDETLSESPEWKGKSVSKRLAEVQKKTEARFDWDNNPNREKGSGLESFVSGKSKGGKVALSDTELQIANGLGISPERFLAQKKAMEKGK